MHDITDNLSAFADRGTPRSDDDHFNNVLLPALDALQARAATIERLFSAGHWDPEEAGCIDRFQELVAILDAGLSVVAELKAMMPPIAWRGVHRELTRAAAQQARGQIHIALAIVAPDVDAALAIQQAGTQAFDASALHANRVAAMIDLIRDEPSDGPFQLDGSLDLAALVWSGVRQVNTTIANAAQLVRDYFGDIPDVAALPDHFAVGLLPTLVSGVRATDRDSLTQRVRQLRAILDAADTTRPAWIADPALLIARAHRGLERLNDETERLGREWRYGLPRHHLMRSLTEIYRQLIEGALRDLGGILLIAARATRAEPDGSYEEVVVDGIKAGEVVDELQRQGPPIGGAVDMLFRNASAHGEVEVANIGITATERQISGGRVISSTTLSLSDAEFYEELISLEEILLAIQVAVLPWAWCHSRADVPSALAAMPITDRQRDRTAALLGGLAGLRGVAVTTEGDQLVVSAARRHEDEAASQIGILTLLPPTFGAAPNVDRIELRIVGLHPVAFQRNEFPTVLGTNESTAALTSLALTNAKWLLESGVRWTPRDEATYLIFPLTQLYFGCVRLVSTQPPRTDNIDEALGSLLSIRSRLDALLPAERWSEQTREAVRQIDVAIVGLAVLADSRRGQRTPDEGVQAAREVFAIWDTMIEIHEVAKSIRDGRWGA